jgi:hypothetical protein
LPEVHGWVTATRDPYARTNLRTMIQPIEMRRTLPMTLHGGASSTTTEVWEMLSACRNGDLDRVRQLITQRSELSTCQFNYTWSPLAHRAWRCRRPFRGW